MTKRKEKNSYPTFTTFIKKLNTKLCYINVPLYNLSIYLGGKCLKRNCFYNLLSIKV